MRSDWVGVLEAAYAPARDDQEWADRLVATSSPVFGDHAGITVIGIEHTPDCSSARVALKASSRALLLAEIDTMASALGEAGIRAFYYPPQLVTTMQAAKEELLPSSTATLDRYEDRWGVRDAIGLVTHPEPGLPLVLSAQF